MLACSIFQTSRQAPAQIPPTSAPAATPTEEPAAAQPDAAFQDMLGQLKDKGYIETAQGTFYALDDYKEESAKLNWFSPTTYDIEKIEDFVSRVTSIGPRRSTRTMIQAAAWSLACGRTAMSTQPS